MSLLSCVWVLCVIVVCFVLFLFLFCVVFEFFGEGRFLLFWSCFCCCCFCVFFAGVVLFVYLFLLVFCLFLLCLNFVVILFGVHGVYVSYLSLRNIRG